MSKWESAVSKGSVSVQLTDDLGTVKRRIRFQRDEIGGEKVVRVWTGGFMAEVPQEMFDAALRSLVSETPAGRGQELETMRRAMQEMRKKLEALEAETSKMHPQSIQRKLRKGLDEVLPIARQYGKEGQ